MPGPFRHSFAVCGMSAAALAQTIWNVPDGADLTPYISQASPGDILQLGAQHPGFALNKGLTIVGLPLGTTIGLTPVSLPASVQVSVPPGQRASLMRLNLPVGNYVAPVYWSTLTLQSGVSVLADVVIAGDVVVQGGSHVMQRLTVSDGGLRMNAGICAITDSSVSGRRAGGSFFQPSTSAITVLGGTLVGSRLVARGGDGFDYFYSTLPASPGVLASTGNTFLTDSVAVGGSGMMTFTGFMPGAAGFVGNTSLAAARTSFTGGAGPTTTPSSAYQHSPEMVGMSCTTPLIRGATSAVTATAGDSQGPLAIVGGFDASPTTLPPVVEPLFGIPAQLVVLTLALPAPGAPVTFAVSVPNVAGLYGADVWLQAIQLTATAIRASAVVGGTIR